MFEVLGPDDDDDDNDNDNDNDGDKTTRTANSVFLKDFFDFLDQR